VKLFWTNHSQHVFNPKACQLSVMVDDKKVTSRLSCLWVMKWISVTHPVSNCKLSYHSAKPTITINFKADLSSYSATDSQHNLWNKMVKNKYIYIYIYIYIITDFPTGDAVATLQLMASHNYLAAHLYICCFIHPFCVSCAKKVST
jgi:hypothetical protein